MQYLRIQDRYTDSIRQTYDIWASTAQNKMCRLHTILCVRWGIPPTDMQNNHRPRRKEKEGQWCVKQFKSFNFDIKTSSVNPNNQCQIAIMEKQPHAHISQKKLKETTKILDNFQKQLEENLSKTREIYGKAIKYMDGL